MYTLPPLCTKLFSISVICLVIFNPVSASNISIGSPQNFVPGEVLVKFKPGHDQASRNWSLKKSGSFLKQRLNNNSLEHWKLPINSSVEDTIKQLRDSGTVEYAEPNYIRQPRVLPNDPLLGYSWALSNTGQVVPGLDSTQTTTRLTGVPGMDLQLQQAWDITKGSKNVAVAIIDDGIDLDHPDLRDNIWVNSGEVASDGIDNDNNDYIDDTHGWDIADNDNDPNHQPENDHGSSVAGATGAVGNNGTGVSGAAWNVSLMAVRTDFSDAANIASIDYAIKNGADIVNASWGSAMPSQALADAVTRMEQAGVLLVVAAGNSQLNNDYVTDYPSGYLNSNVVSVTSSNPDGTPTAWAHIGQTSVDIAAPGVGVFLPIFPDNTFGSTDENGNRLPPGSLYGYTDGTSFSAPYVAGVAALLKTRYPQADHRELKARLLAGVRPFSNNWEYLNAGNGHSSALRSLQANPAPLLVINKITTKDEQGAANNHYVKDQTYTLDITLENLWKTAGNVSATLKTADAFVHIKTDNISYGTITNNMLKSQNALRFSLTEDPGERPLRFVLSLSADNGYTENRRFILENTKTIDQALLFYNSNGFIIDTLQPEQLTILKEKGDLTLPAEYRFVSGIDMDFSRNITPGDTHGIGWKLSYLPDNAQIYSCKGLICDTPLPDESQPPQLLNQVIHDATDGGDFDGDGTANGTIKSTLVLLQKCAEGHQCDATADSGGGGSLDQGWLLLMLLMLSIITYRARINIRH